MNRLKFCEFNDSKRDIHRSNDPKSSTGFAMRLLQFQVLCWFDLIPVRRLDTHKKRIKIQKSLWIASSFLLPEFTVRQKQFAKLLVGCLILLFPAHAVMAQATTQKLEKPIKVEFSKQMRTTGDRGLLSAVFDAGTFQAGRSYEIEVDLTSPLARQTSFEKLISSYGFSSISADKMSLGPDEPTRFLIKLSVPMTSHVNDVSAGFNIYSDAKGEDLVGIVVVRGKLSGNLHISLERSLFEIKDKLEVCRLPFICTAPIETQNLQLEISESLKGVVGEIVLSSGDRHTIQLTVAKSIVGESGIAGSVKLTDKKTGITSDAELFFTGSSPLTISPTILRFRPIELGGQEKPEKQQAVVLLRFEESFLEALETKKQAPSIECSLDNVKLNRQIQRLGDTNVFRVVVTMPISDESPEVESPQKILWRIGNGRKVLLLETILKQ